MRTARLLIVSHSIPWEGGLPNPNPLWMQTPPVNRMTDRCKNITLPQTSFAGGNKSWVIAKLNRQPGVGTNKVGSSEHLVILKINDVFLGSYFTMYVPSLHLQKSSVNTNHTRKNSKMYSCCGSHWVRNKQKMLISTHFHNPWGAVNSLIYRMNIYPSVTFFISIVTLLFHVQH